MYSAPVYVDSRAAVRPLPDRMYSLPNVTSPTEAVAGGASPTPEAALDGGQAEELALCRLRRLQGDLALIARVRGIALAAGQPAPSANQSAPVPAPSANQSAPVPAPSANQRAPAPAANQAAGGQGLSGPQSLALHCRPDRPPTAALALLLALRAAGKRVHVTGHLHSAAGAACRPGPALAEAVRRLEAGNPERRAGADLCVTLVWRGDLDDCCLAADVFNGHPLLGEALALRAVNLAAGRPLPEDWPLLDFADLQLPASVEATEAKRRLEPLLAASAGGLSLGKIFLAARLLASRQPLPQPLAEVAASPPFAEVGAELLAA